MVLESLVSPLKSQRVGFLCGRSGSPCPHSGVCPAPAPPRCSVGAGGPASAHPCQHRCCEGSPTFACASEHHAATHWASSSFFIGLSLSRRRPRQHTPGAGLGQGAGAAPGLGPRPPLSPVGGGAWSLWRRRQQRGAGWVILATRWPSPGGGSKGWMYRDGGRLHRDPHPFAEQGDRGLFVVMLAGLPLPQALVSYLPTHLCPTQLSQQSRNAPTIIPQLKTTWLQPS